MTPRTPALAVVVPATDAPPTLPRCLAALDAANTRVRAEIVVVDAPSRLDVCTARNRGAEKAGADVVVFVDADVEIAADALNRVAAAFARDPGLTALFGSYDDAPPRGGAVSAFRNLLHHHVHRGSAGTARTFWSGLGAVRRAEFLATGGFDARRYAVPSVEDVDLGARLVANGARIELDPRIQGTHLKVWTLRSMVVTDFARRGVPWVALVLRSHGAGATALNLGWRHRLSAVACLAAAAALFARRPGTGAGAAVVLLALNHDFYRLLARRRGVAEAALGVGLHAVHHLTAVASVPFGVAVHLRDRVTGRQR